MKNQQKWYLSYKAKVVKERDLPANDKKLKYTMTALDYYVTCDDNPFFQKMDNTAVSFSDIIFLTHKESRRRWDWSYDIEPIYFVFDEVPSKHGIGHKEGTIMNDNCN